MENINKEIAQHELFMQRCLDLAFLGKEAVAPNPMVAAVLVYENKIISEAYHQKFGGQHAEINCFDNIPLAFKKPEILVQCTLYVNLEPCCHQGKTPPCTTAIIALGIKKVVIGSVDKNPLVKNKGIEVLENAGIKIIYPVLEKKANELNKMFFHFHECQKPYVILKWAESANGCIANKNFEVVKISNPLSNIISHEWRANNMAIMIGTNTAILDNPQLTTRHVFGKNPIKIILDKNLTIPRTHLLFLDKGTPIYIFNEKINELQEHIKFVKINFDENVLENILNYLYEENIMSIIVEGGAKLLQSFIDRNLWQEARIIKSKNIQIENGYPAPLLKNASLIKKNTATADDINFYEAIKK